MYMTVLESCNGLFAVVDVLLSLVWWTELSDFYAILPPVFGFAFSGYGT